MFTNKYAEGYPGRRYYGGCEYVDVVEDIARDRAKELFGAEFAYVQPHSGASANAAVLMTLMEPGEKLLGLDLAHGGHLTHGMRLNFSGKLYETAAYGVSKEDHRIDMDEVRSIALAEKPKVIVAGWSAYPRTLDFAAFRSIADEVGAHLWVDMAHFAGLVAAGVHPSPVPHADVVSTTVHKTLGGPRGGIDDMFERLPAIAVTDLKPGDVVAVSSSKTADETKVSAIKVLAGVGPFIAAAQMQAASQGGRGGAGQTGFSIPGLDGFDFGGN